MTTPDQFDYEEKRSFGARWGFIVGVGAIAIVGVFLLVKMFSGSGAAAQRKPPELVSIHPLPPPPPPPPPATPPPQAPKQEMMTQEPLNEQDTKPADAPPDPSPALGTNLQGTGGPDYGLARGGGGGGRIGGSDGKRGSQFGWYAREVVGAVNDALRSNPQTRDASFASRTVRLWLDGRGRVTRVRLAQSTGDEALDRAIQNQVLAGLQFPSPPPSAMPMPIVIRLAANRPNK